MISFSDVGRMVACAEDLLPAIDRIVWCLLKVAGTPALYNGTYRKLCDSQPSDLYEVTERAGE